MKNTFWTLIEDNYYRIHNGILKYAPVVGIDKKIALEKESYVDIISIEQLKLINYEFGCNFMMSDFL